MIRILSVSFGLFLLMIGSGILFEPEYLIGATATDQVVITQVVSTAISITDCSNFSMNPATLSGVGDGTIASGSCTWTVKTSNSGGFNMTLVASSDPALCVDPPTCATSFTDYTETANGTPDYSFSVASTDAEFGYTVEPETAADTVQKFLDNGSSACGTGATNGTNTCFMDFSTTAFTVINRTSATDSTGEAEVMKVWDQIGTSKVQTNGTYTATITATATDN